LGAELVFALCEAKSVEVVILNRGEDTTLEEDLAKDVLEIIIDVRKWTCTNCDETNDRDLNAAINLSKMAASSAVTVCGESSSGAIRKARVKPSSSKQKLGFAPLMSCS
jgi:transposase